jgi:hypothetical protein
MRVVQISFIVRILAGCAIIDIVRPMLPFVTFAGGGGGGAGVTPSANCDDFHTGSIAPFTLLGIDFTATQHARRRVFDPNTGTPGGVPSESIDALGPAWATKGPD